MFVTIMTVPALAIHSKIRFPTNPANRGMVGIIDVEIFILHESLPEKLAHVVRLEFLLTLGFRATAHGVEEGRLEILVTIEAEFQRHVFSPFK